MGRTTALPDPFVRQLIAIPGFEQFTTGFTLCAECERCERSVVYLTPAEQVAARRLRLRMYGKGSATRINRQGCRCPFYLGPTDGCSAYADRPLICHLFPFDILVRRTDGTYWWVLFEACEEVARGKLKGRVDEARTLAAQIDRRMPDGLRRAFMADAVGALFEPTFHEHPVHYLLPLTPPAAQAHDGAPPDARPARRRMD
jgi:Fe-S-cluster containining protein